MRRIDLTFSALQLPIDFFALLGAAITAYTLRFSKTFIDLYPILQDIPFSQYLATAMLFATAWLLFFAIAGLYTTRPRKAWNELGRIILACTTGMMLVIATVFFRREVTASRFLVLAVWGLSIVYVLSARLILRAIRHELLRAKIGHQRIALIGKSKTAKTLVDLYQQRPILGITVIKTIPLWNESTSRELEQLKQQGQLDGILMADPEIHRDQAVEIITFAEEHHLTFRYLADTFAATFTNIEVSTTGGVPIIEVKRTPLDGWGRIAKRALDIIFSFFLLILVSPILLLFSLALLIEDGLPVIFQNTRVGEGAKPFKLYKLRSMWCRFCIGPQFKQDEEERLRIEKELIKQKSIKEGPVYKIAKDPRITPIGHFIRRWSIDELPQLWNVFIGDMSFVGPRPHQPREVEQYRPSHRRVLAIKPGITGLAQISGRSDLEFEDEVRLDLWYIENWSLSLDFYILAKTPFAVLQRKGVY